MLWSEFIEGTGCKDTEKNYNVYKELELIYMNTDCTKAHIYEMGKKLVDNSKTEAEREFERKVKEEIQFYKNEVERFNSEIAWAKEMLAECKEQGNDELAWFRKNDVKWYTERKKEAQRQIKALKWVLA